MKVAIMQPYVFPYIGYYQLIYAVDKLIIYDDVTYIKQGWINRNNILINKQPYLFTIPLINPSSSKLIYDTEINLSLYKSWRKKFLKSLEQNYKHAPFFEIIYPKMLDTFNYDFKYIKELAEHSLILVMNYLNLEVNWTIASSSYNNKFLRGKDRVIDICKQENATIYINPIGGIELYDKKDFNKEGINLQFLKSKRIEYDQENKNFVPNLSIIDILMFNSPKTIHSFLKEYILI